MDLCEKLEEFGLKTLIKDHQHDLCNITVNQRKMASLLKFDFDQIAIIMEPPDSFTKCHRMYELIEKTAAPNFLEVLKSSNNGHVLSFIQSVLTGSSSSEKRGIWFNIPEPVESFCGREGFLSQLHLKLRLRDGSRSMSMLEVTVLSQLKVVSGLGGIGKTQTVRRYMMKYFEFYNNFIWINAETENSMKSSFLKLAEVFKIPVQDPDGKSREIEKIVKEIYNNIICEDGKSNLIVFDNAEHFESCKNFLPIQLHPDLKKPTILATSRNQEWVSPNGRIQILPLDVLTDDESLEFILEELEIPDSPKVREDSKEFIQLMGGIPLALQNAVIYIKQEKKRRKFLPKSYQVKDYVLEFKSSMKKFLSLSPVPAAVSGSSLSATAFVTQHLAILKLFDLDNGAEAVKILELLSFLYAHKIPSSFLRDLVPEIGDEEFSGALKLLEKYSMIKINEENLCLSIHPELQLVILQYLRECDDLSTVFIQLVEKCRMALKTIKLSAPELSDIFFNLHHVVNNHFDLIPKSEKFFDFLGAFAAVLWEASSDTESLNLYRKIHSNFKEFLGENHTKILTTEHNIAHLLDVLGRDEEALKLYKQTLKKEEIHLGPDHPLTMTTKHKIANLLKEQEKFDEALELYQHVLAQQIKILGESHPDTIATQNSIALLHLELGDFPKALTLLEEFEEKLVNTLRADHKDVLTMKHNKVGILLKMGRFEDGVKILVEVYEKRNEILGQNHLDTILTLSWIAEALEGGGQCEDALLLYKNVYEIRRTKLGADHPKTIDVMAKIANVTRKLTIRQTSMALHQDDESGKGEETDAPVAPISAAPENPAQISKAKHN